MSQKMNFSYCLMDLPDQASQLLAVVAKVARAPRSHPVHAVAAVFRGVQAAPAAAPKEAESVVLPEASAAPAVPADKAAVPTRRDPPEAGSSVHEDPHHRADRTRDFLPHLMRPTTSTIAIHTDQTD